MVIATGFSEKAVLLFCQCDNDSIYINLLGSRKRSLVSVLITPTLETIAMS
jgi:hypothetical protein